MLSKIARWFSLERKPSDLMLGSEKPAKADRQIVLFTGVLAGAAGQWLFAAVSSGALRAGTYSFDGLVLGLIASVVTFPAIYHNAGLDRTKVTFVKWCVAFQNGFFWPTLLDQVARGFKP